MNIICKLFEEWKTIPGYSNYQVSSIGRVICLRRRIANQNFKGVLECERIMKSSFTKENGWVVGMTDDGGKHQHESIARLILTTFVRLPRNGEFARHLDDNKHNQNLTNLAWGMPKDNTHDALKNGRMCCGTRSNFHKLKEKQVLEIRSIHVPRDKQLGTVGLARKYNVDISTISHIINKHTWKHLL